MLLVRSYPRETQEMVFDAYDRALALFRGTCETTAQRLFVGKDRLYNRRFLQMCSHYLVEPVACTPASRWDPPPCPRNSTVAGRALEARKRHL